jgi:8-oxo-dGTP diphosphatase
MAILHMPHVSTVLRQSRSHAVKGLFTLLKEILRHVLRRPVVGIAACARTVDGKWLLVRRGDTGQWALPGGTLDWGETLREAIVREMEEEAGVTVCQVTRLAGVYSRPDRDPRFHGVTVVVECRIGAPVKPPVNPLEITEVGLFSADEIPGPLAMGMEDMLQAGMTGGEAVLE